MYICIVFQINDYDTLKHTGSYATSHQAFQKT